MMMDPASGRWGSTDEKGHKVIPSGQSSVEGILFILLLTKIYRFNNSNHNVKSYCFSRY